MDGCCSTVPDTGGAASCCVALPDDLFAPLPDTGGAASCCVALPDDLFAPLPDTGGAASCCVALPDTVRPLALLVALPSDNCCSKPGGLESLEP